MKVCNVTHLTLVILLSSAVPLISALNTICENRFNDLSFADPASCSSFYVCQRGNAIRRECSNGLYFDPKIQSCNLPGLVKCFNGERGVALLGAGKINLTQALDPNGNPKAVAATTAATTTICPPTTTTKDPKMVSVTTKSPGSAKESNDSDTIRPSVPVSLEAKIRIDVLRSSRDCRDISDGVYLTDPQHCRRYYMCRKNRPKRHNCPRNQWFNRELLICQDRDEVLNCPSNRN
ncbi:protein obstructor-E [Drosophila subpulchrella]|uniref:protein obstructor-E n=1 Tax=Drosophila subpulchrella TaxID=1486046 RepID=UPI0018A1AB61|nr:protein obstructor-E [Drosophila subpulchrella]